MRHSRFNANVFQCHHRRQATFTISHNEPTVIIVVAAGYLYGATKTKVTKRPMPKCPTRVLTVSADDRSRLFVDTRNGIAVSHWWKLPMLLLKIDSMFRSMAHTHTHSRACFGQPRNAEMRDTRFSIVISRTAQSNAHFASQYHFSLSNEQLPAFIYSWCYWQ